MDRKTYLEFYTNTVMGYSKALQRQICSKLEQEGLITFKVQKDKFESDECIYYVEKDVEKVILDTTQSPHNQYLTFYEKLEFTKLYKYSVPLFFEGNIMEAVALLEQQSKIQKYDQIECIIARNIKENIPSYFVDGSTLLIKFVLQKSYPNPEDYETIDYRYPIIIYFDLENSICEIRYDALKYSQKFYTDAYKTNSEEIMHWVTNVLGIKLYRCEHSNFIDVVRKDTSGLVKVYKQMMDMGAAGSAELTASSEQDYLLPFIGELNELINEHEEMFSKAPEIKQLLLDYLAEKESSANYQYVYLKWVNAVESKSYVVKVVFDYFNNEHTLLQHISSSCNDFGMGRMNNAIRYLQHSGAFVKGHEI